MSFQLVKTVARYEMRTLLRSWFFRIFAGLAIVGLGIFNVAMNVESSGAPWIYKAMAASVPYANLIILNLGQAIVAVFLASEFLKQDKKNDTVEVIYARSMTNTQYIIGKTAGILWVFLVLNVIILVMGIGFSFLNNAASRNILAYFIYPLLISLPTLVFILGLSFFMMVLLKNQAVTFILLLGYIALTIFYLNRKLFHIFDYIAYHVPMMYSNISGFGDFGEILSHRLIYFFIGISLICFTIFKLQRLPQPPNRAFLPLLAGILFLLAGGFFVKHYLGLKYDSQNFKTETIALNNQYCNFPMVTVKKCALELQHQGNSIAANSDLKVINNTVTGIDTLILSLNPALKAEMVTYNQKPVTFSRERHLIFIVPDNKLLPGEQASVGIRYSGTIDENICFLDKTGAQANDNFFAEVFTLRKRYAFLQNNFVCLTSEAFWYPSAWIGYATRKPMYFKSDLVDFALKVKAAPGMMVISQGQSHQDSDGTYMFHPEYPLPRIALLIGNFEKKSLSVDSVEYNIYNYKGHDYFSKSFKNISDTIARLIRDLKQDYESETGFRYPYKRFSIAEVPIHFCLDKHEYSYTSDAVQPEMVLASEKGVAFNSSDFRNRKYRIERDMKRNNEEALPEEVESRMLIQVVKNNLLSRSDQYYVIRDVDWKTFSQFPQFYTFVTQIEPEKWPVLNIALESYYHDRNIRKGKSALWYDALNREEKINLLMSGQSLADILNKEFIPDMDEENQVQLRDLILAKGSDFFNRLRAMYGEKEVDSLLVEFAIKNPFKRLPFESLNKHFRSKTGVNLDSVVNNWYNQKSLPGFVIGQITTYKVIQDEETRYQVRFTVSNTGKTEGLITVNIEENNPNRKNSNWWDDSFDADVSRKVFLPAESSREIGFVFSTEPKRMSVVTHISSNLPYNLVYNFPGFNETRNTAPFDAVKPVPFVNPLEQPGEIVVDNEDSGFSYQQATNQAFLKSMVSRNRQPRYKYSRIRFWNPDREWKAVLRSEFYGQSVHSAHYTRGGSGERKAVWKTAVPESGLYEVYFYINKFTFGWRRNNKAADYNITVFHDSGTEKINQSSEGLDQGWFYLGTFQISDTARVELSNKSNGDMVFADAVKWIKVK